MRSDQFRNTTAPPDEYINVVVHFTVDEKRKKKRLGR
jgi:hypothetical protein